MTKSTLTLATVLAFVATPGLAALRTEVVEYKQDDTVLEGYVAWDDAVTGKAPGVVVVHEWMGLGDAMKRRAEQLAGLGYVAFAADIYGKGVRAKTVEEAAALATKYRAGDRKLLRKRAQAALDALKKREQVDRKRLAAMGYCFGGTTALELARSGADLKGVVSFHGNLATPNPADAKKIRGSVLVLHGADDPFVPAEEVAAFQKEMREAKLDWQMVSYGNAVHSFTQKDAGDDPSKGAAYHALADERSWEEMKRFFSVLFAQK
jgi:dienelactone hydrolase